MLYHIMLYIYIYIYIYLYIIHIHVYMLVYSACFGAVRDAGQWSASPPRHLHAGPASGPRRD